MAKIVFRQKQYWLGIYDTLEEAAEARKQAEEIINEQAVAFYKKWKVRADADPEWGAQNPVRLEVEKSNSTLKLTMLPEL